MGYSIYDLFMKIPGVSTLYLFLREKLFAKKIPKEFEPYHHQTNAELIQDNHGIRVQIGEPPLSSVKARSELMGPNPPLKINITNLGIEILSSNHSFKIEISKSKNGWFKFDLKHSMDQIYGIAEKHGSLNKQGKSYEFWNVDNADMEPHDDPLYKNYPVAIMGSENIWLVIISDFPGYQKWDLEDTTTLTSYIRGTDFTYDLIFATSPKELLTKLAQITGKMELPPLWSLGFHQSRWSYYPASRVIEITQGFLNHGIPIDAIYLDIDYLDGFRSFTYDENNFGDLPSLVDELHGMGLKVICMIDPGIKKDKGYHVYDQGVEYDYFVKKSNGKIYVAPVWAGKSVFPDFFNKEVREWWGGLYREFTQEIGIDGWWNDMNEPSTFTLRGTMPDDLIHSIDDSIEVRHDQVHNLYGQMMVNASYHGLKKLQKGKRVFLLSRSAYIGSQKYGWIWSGDNKSAWDHLRESIPKIIGTGLVGHFANGPDIGGFRGEADPELFARWMEIAVFYPFMRNHYIKFTEQQEPWSFGKEVEEISKKMIKLRYRLMPYIYTQFRQSCESGIPLMRPMFIEFPQDSDCYEETVLNNQFMFGTDLLIAPVIEKGKIAKEVYLPQGTWYQLESNRQYQGGKTVTVAAPLDTINVFVRDNTIVPIYHQVGTNMIETVASGVDFLKFGSNPSGILYIDDGATYEYQTGKFGLYKISSDLKLELIEGQGFDTQLV